MTEGHQRGVDSVLQRGAMAHQVQPAAGLLPITAHPWGRQPDRRHQIPPRQLGQHPRVDLVGPAGQRRKALDLHRVGDLHDPAAQLELVMNEAGAAHRFDHRRDRLTELTQPSHQRGQAAGIRRRRGHQHRLAGSVQGMHIQTSPAQIQPNVQHEDRASFRHTGSSRFLVNDAR
jgi:hypothetical protein